MLKFTFYTDGTFEVEGSADKFEWKIEDDTIYVKRIKDYNFKPHWEKWDKHQDYPSVPKPHMIKHKLKKALAEIDSILLGNDDEH